MKTFQCSICLCTKSIIHCLDGSFQFALLQAEKLYKNAQLPTTCEHIIAIESNRPNKTQHTHTHNTRNEGNYFMHGRVAFYSFAIRVHAMRVCICEINACTFCLYYCILHMDELVNVYTCTS